MPGNLDSQGTQLLYQAPDLRTAGPDFLGNFRATHHDGGVLHQQPDNAAQTEVGLRFVWRGRPRPRAFAGAPACGGFRNAQNYAGERWKEQMQMEGGRPRPSAGELCNDGRGRPSSIDPKGFAEC